MRSILLVCACSVLFGCSSESSDDSTSGATDDSVNPQDESVSDRGGFGAGGPGRGDNGGGSVEVADPVPVPIKTKSGKVTLSAENTRIQFVGTHVGEDPNPRVGVFTKFTGEAEVDTETKEIKSVSVEIETASLATVIDNLTTHLKSPDFFDVREYPTAKFTSTRVAPADGDGKYTISGNLTLLKTTKEVSFPATVTVSDDGLLLTGEFTFDRTEFGMDGVQDRVNKKIALTVTIGQKSQLPQGRRGGRGGRGFDPEAIFKRLDANGDGTLTGDEISGRMLENLEAIDKNGDKEVTLEEFQERMQQFRGGRGGGGRGEGGRGGGRRRDGGSQRPQRPVRPEFE